MVLVTIDHDFRCAGAGIVIRCHAKGIGPGRTDGEQIVLFQTQAAILAKEIAGFANRAYHVVQFFSGSTRLFNSNDFLPGAIQGWPDQVVHGGINDSEVFIGSVLQVIDSAHQNTSIASDRPTWFDDDAAVEALQTILQGTGPVGGARW